jgi:ADP-ribosylation factor protein 1
MYSKNLNYTFYYLAYKKVLIPNPVNNSQAGKSTFLRKISDVTVTIPVIGFNIETVKYKNMTFTSYGLYLDREYPWYLNNAKQYMHQQCHAVIFLIDGNDRARFEKASTAFEKEKSEDWSHLKTENVILLVLVNKRYLTEGIDMKEVVERLKLKDIKGTWEIKECNALYGTGLVEAIEWVYATYKSIVQK